MSIFHIRTLLAALGMAVGAVSGDTNLIGTSIDSIAAVRALSMEQAAKAHDVVVEGQVLWVHPLGAGLFLHDGLKGAYIQNPKGVLSFSEYRMGNWVRVMGVSNPGGFSPSIKAAQIEFVEDRPLMEARHLFPYEIYSTAIDCDWVTLRGRFVDSTVITDYSIIMLELDMNGVTFPVQLVDSPEIRKKLASVMYRQIRFNAVAGTLYNDERQFTGQLFFVGSLDGVTVDHEPKKMANLEMVPIHELLQAGDNYRAAVKTYGTVTYAAGSEIFLRGERACIKASVLELGSVAVGDQVELSGLVAPEPFGPAFLARTVRVLEKNFASVVAVPTKLGWTIGPKLNYELIELDVQLVDVGKSFSSEGDRTEGQVILLCRSGKYMIEARLPESEEARQEWTVGSTLRLTGICHLNMTSAERWRMRGNINSLQMQLRGASDVAVLEPPPWWTTARVLWIAGIGAGLSVLFFVWVVLLRKTVLRQTRMIGAQIKRETILNERQRIARELHDNLEQGLAGTVLQLRGLRKLVDNNLKRHLKSIQQADESGQSTLQEEAELQAGKNIGSIDVISKMLTRCSDEARTSILDLRGGLLERMDLPAALQESLTPLAEECGAVLKIDVTGTSRRLEQSIERNLLQLIKEATANAVRHGKPAMIDVVLDYGPGALRISIADNGCGFETSAPPKIGHFGLLGMQERMNKLKGTLLIESRVGDGTKVSLTLPTDGAD